MQTQIRPAKLILTLSVRHQRMLALKCTQSTWALIKSSHAKTLRPASSSGNHSYNCNLLQSIAPQNRSVTYYWAVSSPCPAGLAYTL